MPKNTMKVGRNRKYPEQVIDILASKHGVSSRMVQLVVAGDKTNEAIFTDYMTYKQEHNRLLKAVKELVPFD